MLKVLELFAGIGACSKALERLGIEHEIVDAVEIDKYAIASFNAIHGTNFEIQDITTWNKDIEADLIMHGSPCQDFSVAGKQAGGDIGSGTRSSLMYETIRIVGKLRPKYIVWENVKNLLSKKHKHNFDAYIETMNILGYNSYYQVLNAKDYGIPQNRERVFTVSIRKDIDKGFEFPQKEELKLRLKDMLEDEVDEKYYLSDTQINKITTSNFMQEKKRIQDKDYSDTILARDWKDPKCVKIGNIYGEDKGTGYAGNVWDKEELSPTLTNMQGGNRQPMIIDDTYKNRDMRVYDEYSPTLRSERSGLKVAEPKIITHNIQQKVKVRKYPVDIPNLKRLLVTKKRLSNISNKFLAEYLGVPQTQMEHYFRIDFSFAIPSPDIWYKLKEILKIETDEFDESIMTFEEKDGVYEKANRVYDEQGLAPTLTQQEEKILIKNNTKQGYLEAYEGDGVYTNTSNKRGTVQPQSIQTITTRQELGVVESGLRIRKLTPKECWRLMGFNDEDFEKAKAIPISNTQLYKQARKLNRRQCIRKNIRKLIKYGGVI